MQASLRIVKKHYRAGAPVLNPLLATRYWLPTTGYFGCGGPPQPRFRFVSKQNASLTFEKENQSCTDL